MGTDGASVLLAVLGLLVNIAFLGFLIIQVSLLRRQVREGNEATAAERLRLRRHATVEHASSTLQRRHDLALSLPMESEQDEVDQFLERIANDRKELQKLYNYLNLWEEFATAVNMEIFDGDVVSRSHGSEVIRVFNAYRTFIRQVREAEDLPFLYTEIERMAASMHERDKALREVQHLSGAALASND